MGQQDNTRSYTWCSLVFSEKKTAANSGKVAMIAHHHLPLSKVTHKIVNCLDCSEPALDLLALMHSQNQASAVLRLYARHLYPMREVQLRAASSRSEIRATSLRVSC